MNSGIRLRSSGSVLADYEDGFWKRATVDTDSELDPKVLAAHQQLCERTDADACLVIHHDRIVQEWYGPFYEEPEPAMSSTKSVTGLLAGMLIADGRIKNPDVSVCSFIETWCSGRRARVTVRHLLTMTSGLPLMTADSSVEFKSDMNEFATRLEPTSEPGTRWTYSNEGVQLLSPILDKAANEPLQDFAKHRLFEPLGMRHTRLSVTQNHAWTFAQMMTTPRDFARLGVLALHHGMWNGKQIVSKSWMEQSTKPSQQLNSWYGLLWWIQPHIGSYAMLGSRDTNLEVIPDLDLVIVRMQRRTRTAEEGSYRVEAEKMYRKLVRSH